MTTTTAKPHDNRRVGLWNRGLLIRRSKNIDSDRPKKNSLILKMTNTCHTYLGSLKLCFVKLSNAASAFKWGPTWIGAKINVNSF